MVTGLTGKTYQEKLDELELETLLEKRNGKRKYAEAKGSRIIELEAIYY